MMASKKRRSRSAGKSDSGPDASEMDSNFALLCERKILFEEQTDVEEMKDWTFEDTVDQRESSESEDDSDDEPESSSLNRSSTSAQSQTEPEHKQDLSTMSFEEILSLQNKMGKQVFKKMKDGAEQRTKTAEPMKRPNKHGPQEISAKKQVSILRRNASVKSNISRDPRFDDLSGDFKPHVFNQTYKFINEIRQREMEMVKKKLKKTKSNEKREEMKYLLKRMENQERSRQREQQQREKELQYKSKQRELVGHGHKPFYLKKSTKKQLELADKYSELKKSGKLENFLSKKRKRNALKDRRKLPHQHKNNLRRTSQL